MKVLTIKPTVGTGLAYGLGLWTLSFFAAGSGHGTYVPMGGSSAPAGWFGVPAAWAGAPILWTGVGILFDWLPQKRQRVIIATVIFVHYVGVIFLLTREPFSDWDQLRRLPGGWAVVSIWGLFYGFGQVLIWRKLIGRGVEKVRN